MNVTQIKFIIFITMLLAGLAKCENSLTVKEWKAHSAKVDNFKCKVPHARNVDIKEFFDESVLNSAKILPASTVLHRCGSSGCCPKNKTCTLVKHEDVKLVFVVIEGPKKRRFVEVTARNHTVCGCHFHRNQPK